MSGQTPRPSPASRDRRAAPCLVTGATGFVGGHLAARLVGEGHPVRCLVRPSSDTTRLQRLGVELAIGDVRDVGSLARALDGRELVVHCAALVSDWATVAEIQEANVTGTRNVLAAAADAAVQRVLHLSTTDVYGHPGGTEVDERHVATRFANWYAQTKLQAEHEVAHAARTRGLRTAILRPATVYGPGSTDVVGEIAGALRAGHMLLVDRGRAIAGLCFVENLIDAAMLALHEDAAVGEAFNVCDGLEVTWRRFTDDLAAGLGCRPARWSLPPRTASALGRSLELSYRLARRASGLKLAPLLSRQAVQVLGVDQSFSTRKARALLGWKPRVGYEDGLRATLAWLAEVG